MVKGISKRVILIKSPDPEVFDEAIFVVREDAIRKAGVTGKDILREAQSAAEEYIRSKSGKAPKRQLPAYVYTIIGAAATGVVWLMTALIH